MVRAEQNRCLSIGAVLRSALLRCVDANRCVSGRNWPKLVLLSQLASMGRPTCLALSVSVRLNKWPSHCWVSPSGHVTVPHHMGRVHAVVRCVACMLLMHNYIKYVACVQRPHPVYILTGCPWACRGSTASYQISICRRGGSSAAIGQCLTAPSALFCCCPAILHCRLLTLYRFL